MARLSVTPIKTARRLVAIENMLTELLPGIEPESRAKFERMLYLINMAHPPLPSRAMPADSTQEHPQAHARR